MEAEFQKELSALIKDQPDISVLFGDLAAVSTSVLQKAIDAAREKLKDTGLPEDIKKALVEGIDKGEKAIASKNPFKALFIAIKDLSAEENKEGEDREKSLKRFNDALHSVNGAFGGMLDTVGQIGNSMGKDWSRYIDAAKTAMNGLTTAFSKGADTSQKVTGIVSAIIAVAQVGVEMIDASWNKSIEKASAYAITLSNQLDEIAKKKGIGDSLFTSDSFNKVKQLQLSLKQGFDEAQNASNSFFDAYYKRLKKLPDSGLMTILDPINLFGWNAKKFEKNNAGAVEFFKGIRKYNMESLEDVNKMLADIDAAYAKTKDKLGTAYLDQAKAAAESAKKNIEDLRNTIKEMVGDIGTAIKDVMLQAYREGASAAGAITDEIKKSLESMIADQMFSKIFGKMFDTFGDDFAEAIKSANPEEALETLFKDLLNGVLAGQNIYFSALDKIKEASSQVGGLSLFDSKAIDEVDRINRQIAQLKATYDQLKADGAEIVDTDKLEKDKTKLEDIAKKIASIEEEIEMAEMGLKNGPKMTSSFFVNVISELKKKLEPIKAEYDALYSSINDREETAAQRAINTQNADGLLKEIELLEQRKEAYMQTLPYIKEQIELIDKQLGGMTYEQLTSEEGKALIARKKELEARQKEFQDAMAGDAEEIKQTLSQLIESEKSKYELYKKWLEEYGEERANEMLAALLSDTNSYINALEAGISEIESKIMSGTATDDDLAQLANWYSQRKDIYDAAAKASVEAAQKALSAWTTSFDEAISGADNAFQKIALISQKLLELDASDLSDEQKESERDRLSKMFDSETNALEKDLLKEFETAQNKKLRIIEDYNNKIALLHDKGHYEEEQLAKEARDKAISELEESALKQSDLWKQLFGGDLAKLGKKAAEQALAEMRKAVEESVELTDEARNKILEDLDKVQADIDKIELDKLNQRLEDTKKKFEDITSVISSIDGLIKDLGINSAFGELAGGVTGILGGVGEAVMGFGTGNYLGGIMAVMKTIGSIAKIFQWFGAQKENAIKKQLSEIQKQYEELEYRIQQALGGETARLQAQQLKNIDQQISKNLELIRIEKNKLSLFRDQEKINALEEENIKLLRQQQDILKQMAEDFLQTDAKSYASTLADALTAPYDSLEAKMKAVEKTSLDVVQNIIKNSLKLRFLEAPIQQALDELYRHGQEMDEEAFDAFRSYVNEIAARFNSEWSKFEPYLGSAQGAIDSTMANAIRGITENQANALVGWASNIGINNVERNRILEDMRNSAKDSMTIQRDMFLVVSGIKQDTSMYLPYLKVIANKMDSAVGNGLSAKGLGGSL